MPKKIVPEANLSSSPVGSTPEFISWADATEKERIERLHFVAKDMIEALNKAQRELESLKNQFYGHDHMNNKVVKPLTGFEQEKQAPAPDTRTDKERWF